MEQIALEAQSRTETGTSHVRRLRREGQVPGVAYGRGRNPLIISLGEQDLAGALKHGANVLIDLRIDGKQDKEKALAMIKEVQRDPLTDRPLNVDLQWISLTDKISVAVPVRLEGHAVGVEEGGVVEQVLREVQVRSLPTEIPEELVLNVAALQIGDSLHVSDLAVPEGAELETSPEETVVVVTVPKVVEEPELEEEEVLAEGEEAPAEGEEEPAEAPAEGAEGEGEGGEESG
ncbi:MAG: 50S ribosomal protein L25 [Armatimonadota bacterium]